jgi:hypothetical protein
MTGGIVGLKENLELFQYSMHQCLIGTSGNVTLVGTVVLRDPRRTRIPGECKRHLDEAVTYSCPGCRNFISPHHPIKVIRLMILKSVSGQLLHPGEATLGKVSTHVCHVFLLKMMVPKTRKRKTLKVRILEMMHLRILVLQVIFQNPPVKVPHRLLVLGVTKMMINLVPVM